MNGIERLRAIAGAWDEWGLGGSLTEIADQIERELVRHDEPDSTDNGTRLLYVTDEDREALEWVRKYGGIGCVQTMAATLGDTLNWIRERAGISKYETVDYDELLDALDRRLMPEGCQWPRYESGELVGFGEEASRLGEVFAICLYCDGSFALNFRAYSKGERVKRHAPAVPASDGEPLEVGQTVWDTNGDELVVVALEDGGNTVTCRYADVGDGIPTHGMWSPSQLTHTKPEPPDSWKRIEEDATLSPEVYCHRSGIDISQKDGTEIFLADTVEPMARDLVRRCRALAERERGE